MRETTNQSLDNTTNNQSQNKHAIVMSNENDSQRVKNGQEQRLT